MSPYKVCFSDEGTSCALLDILFKTGDVTSQEVEQVLRAEIKKHKHLTKRAIRAEAFVEGVDIEIYPFGLPLPDGSHSITHFPSIDQVLTGMQESGGHDNLSGESDDCYYCTDTIQAFDADGYQEWIRVKVVLKRLQFSGPDDFYNILISVIKELAILGKDLTIYPLTGDPRNPVSWRGLDDGSGGSLYFKYEAETGVFRSGNDNSKSQPKAKTKAKSKSPKKSPAKTKAPTKRKRKKE